DAVHQGNPSSYQRSKLPRHHCDVTAGDAAHKSQKVNLAFLPRGCFCSLDGRRQEDPIFAQNRAQRADVLRVAISFDGLSAPRFDSRIFEGCHGKSDSSRHSSTTISSWVAATTSPTVVKPDKTLRAPSSRIVS